VKREASFLVRVTVARIVLIPVVMALVLVGDERRYAYVVAAILFVAAALTDFIDGYLARRWGVTTTLGSFLDTTADKLLVTGALVALVAAGRASVWIAVLIIGREFVILGLRAMVALDGTVMHPSIWGKLKASVQFIAITFAIVRYPHELGPLFLDEYVMIVAAVVTVMSAVEYLGRFSFVLREKERASP
jgi:CDP-diacylglycerol---glycerol-3-phosphate 3-phosphatidyltransferase